MASEKRFTVEREGWNGRIALAEFEATRGYPLSDFRRAALEVLQVGDELTFGGGEDAFFAVRREA